VIFPFLYFFNGEIHENIGYRLQVVSAVRVHSRVTTFLRNSIRLRIRVAAGIRDYPVLLVEIQMKLLLDDTSRPAFKPYERFIGVMYKLYKIWNETTRPFSYSR